MRMPLLQSLLLALPMLLFIGVGLAGSKSQPGGDAIPKPVMREAAPLVATVLGDKVRTDEARHTFYASGGAPSDPSAGRMVTEAVDAPNDAQTGPFAGTNWRLVRFQSMDDAIGEIRPLGPSAYTMTLDADGSVRMQLNCNRAIVGTDGGARYVYGRVDLNADGRYEVLVLPMGPFFCGTGGCNLYLFTESEAGYVLISTFPGSRLPMMASPHKTAGWHDLIQRESGGGMQPAYVRHRFDGARYSKSERLPAEPIPAGMPLLDGDYSYATGFPLPPRPD